MENFFQDIVLWIESSKYFLLFLGTLFEGPFITIISGFLYGLGQFDFLPMYIVLVSGNLIADMIWYSIGRFGTRNIIFKYGYFFGIKPETLQKVEGYFKTYHQKILIISKITTGFGLTPVVLIVSGIFKIPFKNYLTIILLGGLFITTMLLSVGYFFGNIFIIIPNQLKILFIILIISVLIFFIRYINKHLKDKEL